MNERTSYHRAPPSGAETTRPTSIPPAGTAAPTSSSATSWTGSREEEWWHDEWKCPSCGNFVYDWPPAYREEIDRRSREMDLTEREGTRLLCGCIEHGGKLAVIAHRCDEHGPKSWSEGPWGQARRQRSTVVKSRG